MLQALADAAQQVFVVAFVPDSIGNDAIPLPDWASDLPNLATSDISGAGATTIRANAGNAPIDIGHQHEEEDLAMLDRWTRRASAVR